MTFFLMFPFQIAMLTVVKRSFANERSEEHTSELQSHLNLVSRLLLEKKKLLIRTIPRTHSLPVPARESGPNNHTTTTITPPPTATPAKHLPPPPPPPSTDVPPHHYSS